MRRLGLLKIAAVVAGVGVLAAGGWAARGPVAGAVQADLGLAVETIEIDGRQQAELAHVLAAIGVKRGTPILAVDTEAARRRLERLGWVETAQVARRLPNALKVRLAERTPLALWQFDGTFRLIDAGGAVITTQRIGDWRHLPRVVGAGAAEAAAEILPAVQADPVLAARLDSLVRIGNRRWDAVMDSGVVAQLPEGDPAAAWQRLGEIERAHGLLDREVEVIDLRLVDRVTVRLTPLGARLRAQAGQRT